MPKENVSREVIKLHQTMDARVWTKEFNRVMVKNGEQPINPETMIAWFANAIMTGYDHANWERPAKPELVPLDEKEIYDAIIQATKQWHDIRRNFMEPALSECEYIAKYLSKVFGKPELVNNDVNKLSNKLVDKYTGRFGKPNKHYFGTSDLCQICSTPKSMKDKLECKPSGVTVEDIYKTIDENYEIIYGESRSDRIRRLSKSIHALYEKKG